MTSRCYEIFYFLNSQTELEPNELDIFSRTFLNVRAIFGFLEHRIFRRIKHRVLRFNAVNFLRSLTSFLCTLRKFTIYSLSIKIFRKSKF